VIQVDVRGEQIGKRVPVRVPLVGTVKDTIDALLPLIDAKTDATHLDRLTAHYRRARARHDHLAQPGHGGPPSRCSATAGRRHAARPPARRHHRGHHHGRWHGGRRGKPAPRWHQPILRFADTVIGVAIGIAAAWIGLRMIRPRIQQAG